MRIAAQEEDELDLDELLSETQEEDELDLDESLSEAQEDDDLDWDIDSLFDKPLSETKEEKTPSKSVSSVLSSLKRRGLTVNASYNFKGSVLPGWDIPPWDFDGSEVFTWSPALKMSSSLGLDAQISDAFRVLTVYTFYLPGFKFTLGDFYFDYNIFNTVFIRAGKYRQTWGISPNYNFTNLLARIPSAPSVRRRYGTSYIFKVDIPVGVGGVQMLALTRVKMMDGAFPLREDYGFGVKYNLAFRRADIDFGVYYQKIMATRSFLSIKTTIMSIEFYNEWLAAIDTNFDNAVSFAANIGFTRNFFDKKLSLNGEFFYNGEKGAMFYRPESDLLEEETIPFIENYNVALNLTYKFGGKINPSFFTQVLYAPLQYSARVIPGFKFSPLTNIEIYLAVPMALGNKEGYYYLKTEDRKNRPFYITLLVTFKGSIKTTSTK